MANRPILFNGLAAIVHAPKGKIVFALPLTLGSPGIITRRPPLRVCGVLTKA